MAKIKSELGEFLSNLVVLLAGVYFVNQREHALEHLVILIAAGLLAAGVWGAAKWLFTKPRPDAVKLAMPIFLAVLSVVVFFLRGQILGFAPMLIGIVALLGGILQCLTVIKSATAKQKAWWLHAPSALLWLTFGILVLTGVLNLNNIFTLVVGILLIVFGAIGLVESIAVLFMRKE